MASAKEVQDARETFLAGPLPTRAEITGGVCTAYGLNTWGHLYSDRQIVALLTLGDLIRDVRSQVESDAVACGMDKDKSIDYARAVTTFLALAVDRCADFNNTLCRWSPSNQKVMNLFGKQALPMVFDYAEGNILGESVGAWKTCVEYVADCIRTIATRSNSEKPAKQIDAASESNGIKNLLIRACHQLAGFGRRAPTHRVARVGESRLPHSAVHWRRASKRGKITGRG
jgi:adenine-specific DNA methylase